MSLKTSSQLENKLFHFSSVVDGGWGQWSTVGQCSASCGGGRKVRTRECNAPVPRSGGKECDGGSTDATDCNTTPCKGITCRNLASIIFFFFRIYIVVLISN